MKFRLEEGNGLAYYYIGVEDNGNALGLVADELMESLGTLFFMARNLNA
jgi:elongation factor 1-alpha